MYLVVIYISLVASDCDLSLLLVVICIFLHISSYVQVSSYVHMFISSYVQVKFTLLVAFSFVSSLYILWLHIFSATHVTNIFSWSVTS